MIRTTRALGPIFFGLVLSCSSLSLAEPLRRGDVNLDGQVDLGDIVGILKSLYGSESTACPQAADANVDGRLDLADAIRISQQVFLESDEIVPSGDEPADDEPNPCASAEEETSLEVEDGSGGGTSLLWSDTLDSMPPSGPGKYLYTAPPGAIKVQTIAGKKGLAIQCIAGQARDSNGRVRSELSLWQAGRTSKIFRKDPIGSERWYAFSVYIPTSWMYDENKVHLLQWHGTEDPGETGIGRNPALTIIALKGELRIRQLWSARRIQTTNENRVDIWKGKLEKGVWMRWVFHMKWSYKSDGFLEIWKDGKKIIDQENHPNCYNDAEGPYFNLGVYWPGAISRSAYPSSAQHTVHYDTFRIGDSRNVLSDLAP